MKAIGVRESQELVLLCLSQTVQEEELARVLRRSALAFKRDNGSVMPAYLGFAEMEDLEEALSLDEAVEMALQL